jgi:hypothetical protein
VYRDTLLLPAVAFTSMPAIGFPAVSLTVPRMTASTAPGRAGPTSATIDNDSTKILTVRIFSPRAGVTPGRCNIVDIRM